MELYERLAKKLQNELTQTKIIIEKQNQEIIELKKEITKIYEMNRKK